MNNTFKKAFSLTETIIILTVLAVAVAASTPLITKKVINVADAGTTITGAAHGRYEIFTKEIITTPDGDYEKTSTPPETPSGLFGGGTDSNIIAFRRLSDEEYINILNEVPSLSTSGNTIGKYKDTLYEQINDVRAIRNADGKVTFVEFKRGDELKKFPVGGNIIVENANLVYKRGCLGWVDTSKEVRIFVEAGESKEFYNDSGAKQTKCNVSVVKLPNDKNRLIEGVYTHKIVKKLNDNTLWHAQVNNPQYDFDCDDTAIPWERIYSSTSLIVDRPVLPIDEDNDGIKDFIGTFDPGEKAINLVVHAVGGGGAGGGLKDAGKVISPATADSKQIIEMKKELAARFNKITGANIPEDTLVRIEHTSPLYNQNSVFVSDDNYIVINTHDGTISVKVDVRSNRGYQVFPHQLLQYTKVLGSQSQKADVYKMPLWGDFQTIWKRGFRAAVAGQGARGGDGPKYTVDTSDKDLDSKQAQYAGFVKYDDIYECCIECPPSPCCCGGYTSCYTSPKTGETSCSFHCSAGETKCCCNLTNTKRVCNFDCSGPNYPICAKMDLPIVHTHKGETPPSCPTFHGNFVTADCFHQVIGGQGGSPGNIAVACTRVNAPIYQNIFCDKDGAGSKGTASKDKVKFGETVTVASGTKGRTCWMFSDSATAMSTGGAGGMPCEQEGTVVEADSKGPLAGMSKTNIGKAAKAFYAGLKEGIIPASEGGNGKATYTHAYFADPVLSNHDFYGNTMEGTKYISSENINDARRSVEWKNEVSQTSLLKLSEVRQTTFNEANESLLTQGATKLKCSSETKCGADGVKGTSYGVCDDFTGISFIHGAYSNHIYSWTVPYAINQLKFGDAGQAGEYKTIKMVKVDQPIKIRLGRGGVWKKPAPSITPDWEKGRKGPNGTDTIVSMGSRKVLIAKGGKGGDSDIKTLKYDLCYPIDSDKYMKKDTYPGVEIGVCRPNESNKTEVGCCNKENGTRTTRDIAATALNLSTFENIKSLVGNSLVIGIGAGRGGEGLGSRAGLEEVGGTRTFTNISGAGVYFSQSSIFEPYTSQIINNGSNVGDKEYNNAVVKPSEHNFRGGDGAVIITW